MGFCGRLGQQGGRRGFCEKIPESAPYQTEPVLADSKTDQLLAKAEPISSTGGTPAITYLKGKKYCAAAVREEEENVTEATMKLPNQ